jgi:pyridoxine kinase
MAQVLALSSSVARGYVGLAAIVPALQSLGHEIVALPTVLLSNHLGHPKSTGLTVPVKQLTAMLDAIDANGGLAEIDAVLTGYLPSPGHAHFASNLVSQVRRRRPDMLYLCDPVLGDDPDGLYVDPGVASLLRDVLLPEAQIATPNRFELAWLTGGTEITGPEDACAAARSLPVPAILATSIPAKNGTLANLLVTSKHAHRCTVSRLSNVPHGTGDFLAATYLGLHLTSPDGPHNLGQAAAAAQSLVEESLGRAELDMVGSRNAWRKAPPLVVERV